MAAVKLFQRGDGATRVSDDEHGETGSGENVGGSVSTRSRAYTPAKGRATPKRRDAEPLRRGPAASPPRTQREALKRSKSQRGQNRSATAERRERMAAGDDRYVMRRDKGPVRAYARNVIDSRRNLMGLFMPIALVIVILLFAGRVAPGVQQVLTLVVLVFLVAMLTEGIYLATVVNRKVRAKFPDSGERPLSLGWYVFIRATQIRRLRMPKPQVKPGQKG
jgi:hypothetical protein